mgnify:CR=1 FL=1
MDDKDRNLLSAIARIEATLDSLREESALMRRGIVKAIELLTSGKPAELVVYELEKLRMRSENTEPRSTPAQPK